MTNTICCRGRDTPSSRFGLLKVDVVRDDPDQTVIVIRGELDRPAVPRLAGCLREILDTGDPGSMVVLDLTGMGFADLGGMRLLMKAAEWANARDISLHLAGCSASLLRLLHLSGLLDKLDPVPSRTDLSSRHPHERAR